MKIVWDTAKLASNQRKHGVSFEEVVALLSADEFRLEIYDEAHSTSEERFLAIGPTAKGLVVVVYSEPREDVLRIISARRATRREAELYANFATRGKP
ncbi:MAG: BrnT family toxin [Candidatus Binatia bacterium]